MNEREEMEADNSRKKEKQDEVRGEAMRVMQGCRSAYLVGVTPSGEMVNICFYAGYADMKAMQIESRERLTEIIMAISKHVPTQAL
jgi:hypothetical protein